MLHGVAETFSTDPPLSLYGTTKRASEHLTLEYAEAFDMPVWVNRCGVLAGGGQFGRADQGVFSYWIHRWADTSAPSPISDSMAVVTKCGTVCIHVTSSSSSIAR